MITSNNQKNNFIILSLGSNLGDKSSNLKKAIELLSSNHIIYNFSVSSIYESEPVGYLNQPWFFNIAIAGYTDFEPEELLSKCKNIESAIGRLNREHWHEREIDIDIIFYNNIIIDNDMLTIPHKHLHNRLFVLIPVSQIAEQFVHPIFNKSIKDLLSECSDKSTVKKNESFCF